MAAAEGGFGGGDDLVGLRDRRLFEMPGIGDRHLLAADAGDRRVELPEGLLDDAHADLRGEAAAAPAFVDDDGAARLAHRGDDGRVVERPQAAQVDHLGVDVLGGKRGGRVERLPERAAIGDERNVAPGAADRGPVDVDRAGVRRELAGHVVEHDVLEDQHRVGILQRRPQHAARVLERRRRQHLDAGNVRIPAFEAVRMLRRELAAGAGRHADDQRARRTDCPTCGGWWPRC